MKQVYLILFAFVAFATSAMAQNNDAISGCINENGALVITFDNSLNCTSAPGDFTGMDTIGFHSGANQWANVVAWDQAVDSNVTAINNGSDVFTVTIADVQAYYGLTADPATVYFVFNAGNNDANPWSSEGKDNDGAGGCADFFVDFTALAACSTSDFEVAAGEEMTIAPNPMTGASTTLMLANPNNDTYNMMITNAMGQVVRTVNNVTGNVVNIERGNLTTGLYFIVLTNEKGASITERMIVQ